MHGDLQVDHVFVEGDEVTGILAWSKAARGDPLYDLATLTLGHPEHLGDVIARCCSDVDRNLIRAWWSLRCLTGVRWLLEHGYGRTEDFPEVKLLRAHQRPSPSFTPFALEDPLLGRCRVNGLGPTELAVRVP